MPALGLDTVSGIVMEQEIKVLPANRVKIHRPDDDKHNNQYAPRSRIYVRDVKGCWSIFGAALDFYCLLFLLPSHGLK